MKTLSSSFNPLDRVKFVQMGEGKAKVNRFAIRFNPLDRVKFVQM